MNNLSTLLLTLIFITSNRVLPFSPTNSWRNCRIGGRIGAGGIGGNGGKLPPSQSSSSFDDSSDNEDIYQYMGMAASIFSISSKEGNSELHDLSINNENRNVTSEDIYSLRGGSKESKSTDTSHNLLTEGSKSTFRSTLIFWSDSFQSLGSSLSSLINRVIPSFLSRRDSSESIPDLASIKIEKVVAPNSTILPATVVRFAAQRSGLLGSAISADAFNQCAREIKKWYIRRGHVLHSVTGVNLNIDNGTASLSVEEPLVSDDPIHIQFAKQVPIDPETGEATTIKKYRKKWENLKGPIRVKGEWEKVVAQLNKTLIKSTGRTNPRKISKCLSLRPGEHFCWDADPWMQVVNSGVFSQVWRTAPTRMEDGTVQLRVLAEEAPSRNLEYGISKSLYTGTFEGELDFSHRNLFGGGEKFGVIVRRGTKDKEASVKIRFSDDRFGGARGYNVEVFNDYLSTDNTSDEVVDDVSDGDTANEKTIYDDDEDSLLCRKGLTYRIRNPLPQKLIRKSSSSTSFEQTATRNGKDEFIGSFSLDLGPFESNLPLGARANVFTRAISGTRIIENGSSGDEVSKRSLLPYSSATVTTRQIFPLLTETYSPDNKEVLLALEHSVFSSTKNLPRHEANAAGFEANVRGYTSASHEPIRSSLVGSTEFRLPVIIPIRKDKIVQDASLVVFGDWMFALRRHGKEKCRWEDSLYRQSSVGIGLRKTIQGIPVKYDISYTENGKIGTSFGLGFDWDI